MKAFLLLRIACIVVLLELAGHTWLFVTYAPKHGPEEAAVIAAMQSRVFSFSGFEHTYWELYTGYGLFVSVSLLIELGLLWKLASLAKSGAPGAASLITILALGEACYTGLMCKYFFMTPIASHSVMCLLLAAAACFTRSVNLVPSFPSAVQPRESLAR